MKDRVYFLLSVFFILTLACKAISLPNTSPVTSLPPTNQNNQTETPDNTEWSIFLREQLANAYVTDMIQDKNGNLYAVMHQFDSSVDDKRYMSLVKVDNSGKVEWSILVTDTLKSDGGSNLALDDEGNIYVTGTGDSTWGNPINPFVPSSGTPYQDSFLVKVNTKGEILWNTFLEKRYIAGISVDSKNNIYLLNVTDGKPELNETALLVLNSDGEVQQKYDLGNIYDTNNIVYPQELTIDANDNLYVYGPVVQSLLAEGTEYGVFVAKLSHDDKLLWKTIVPSANHVEGYTSKILIDDNENIYLIGNSNKSWGNPITQYDGGHNNEAGLTESFVQGIEYFVAKLDNNGTLLWNTFLNKQVYVSDCAMDKTGNLYITGSSVGSWGAPLTPYNANNGIFSNGFIVQINSNGSFGWNMFTGDNGIDKILIGNDLDLYIIGRSYASDGNTFDVFITKTQLP